jgi:hypothetical protein
MRVQYPRTNTIMCNNYHFHVENFYDYLHLDREASDLDRTT